MSENDSVWENELKSIFSAMFALLILGAIGYLITVNFLLQPSKRAKVSIAKSDMHHFATALESYFVDNSAYPLHTYDPAYKDLFTGYPEISSLDIRYSVTTPICYINGLPLDPFYKSKKNANTYAYWSNGYWWFLASRGYDEDFDTDFRDLEAAVTYIAVDDRGTTQLFQDGSAFETYFLPIEYDPSNGSKSSGDIFRVGGGGYHDLPVSPSFKPRYPGDITRVVKTTATLKKR